MPISKSGAYGARHHMLKITVVLDLQSCTNEDAGQYSLLRSGGPQPPKQGNWLCCCQSCVCEWLGTTTYKHYDEEVYHAVDSTGYNLYEVAVGALSGARSIPKVMNWLTASSVSAMISHAGDRAHHWNTAVNREPRK